MWRGELAHYWADIVAGKILTRRSKDYVQPPQGPALTGRIAELDLLIEELVDVFHDCPEFLTLPLDSNEISSPNLSIIPVRATAAQHGIGVQQSNLYVSQQAIRLVAIQYRKDLLDLREFGPVNESDFRAERDDVLSTLLRVLRALPMELMGESVDTMLMSAVNTFPGLSKIRYVASTLLSDQDVVDPQSLAYLRG